MYITTQHTSLLCSLSGVCSRQEVKSSAFLLGKSARARHMMRSKRIVQPPNTIFRRIRVSTVRVEEELCFGYHLNNGTASTE